MMSREAVIARYTALGLEVEEGVDTALYRYEAHRHETTYLWTVAGSIRIKKDTEDWVTYKAGEECIIADGELHEAEVGVQGWRYIAGWNPKEALKYDQ